MSFGHSGLQGARPSPTAPKITTEGQFLRVPKHQADPHISIEIDRELNLKACFRFVLVCCSFEGLFILVCVLNQSYLDPKEFNGRHGDPTNAREYDL